MSQDNTDTTDIDLEYVRGKRKMIIEGLTAKGVPDDTKDVQTLLTALADMDRAALSKKKIKVDKDVGDSRQQAMEMIAYMFSDSKLKKYGVSDTPCADVVLPYLDDSIPAPVLVEGETSIHITTENYDAFMKRLIIE